MDITGDIRLNISLAKMVNITNATMWETWHMTKFILLSDPIWSVTFDQIIHKSGYFTYHSEAVQGRDCFSITGIKWQETIPLVSLLSQW